MLPDDVSVLKHTRYSYPAFQSFLVVTKAMVPWWQELCTLLYEVAAQVPRDVGSPVGRRLLAHAGQHVDMREIASTVRAAAPWLKTDLNSGQLINMNDARAGT